MYNISGKNTINHGYPDLIKLKKKSSISLHVDCEIN